MIMNNLRFVKINIHNTEYIYDYNEVLELYALFLKTNFPQGRYDYLS